MVSMCSLTQVCWYVFAVTLYLTQSTTGAEQADVQNALRIVKELSESRSGLAALNKIVSDIDGDLLQAHQIEDLGRKRQGLLLLKDILQQMDADLIHEQKRTCTVNLGGHCSTESAASVADQWHYLNSHLSPGRKRRDTRLYQRLIQGKLFRRRR